jgi:hypothetical protein
VAAFITIIGTLAWVAIGAAAKASGVRPKLDGGVDLAPGRGEGPRHRHDQANLQRLGRAGAGRCESGGQHGGAQHDVAADRIH